MANQSVSRPHPHQRKIFVPMVGQHENIGDIILRRPLLRWLRDLGEVHTYVGPPVEGYSEGLGISREDRAYHSFRSWYFEALKAAARGQAHYAFKPGEIQLSLTGLKEHISMLPVLVLVRLRGGKVVRIGSGARNFTHWPRWLMMPSIWLSNLVRWRDARTTAFMGCGQTMPDLGFAEGPDTAVGDVQNRRDLLILSMRGDRPDLSAGWIEGVRLFAEKKHLDIWVVTQVHRDSELTNRLAAALQAQVLDWDGRAHDEQERTLRALYDRTAVVVSDRLHVLIAAFTHGAAPVGLLPYASDKIDRHFNAAGVHGICVMTEGCDAGAISDSIEAVTEDRARFEKGLASTRQQLAEVRAQVTRLLDTRGR